MKDSRIAIKIYIYILMLFALMVLIYISRDIELNMPTLKGFLFFTLLALITDSLPVKLPKGGNVSVTLAVACASIILFGPAVSAYALIFSELSTTIGRRPWYKVAFNVSQITLAAGLSGMVYLYMGGHLGSVDLYHFLPYIGAAITYVAINCTAVSLVVSMSERTSIYGVWLTNIRWLIPNLIMLAPVGLLMAKVYSYIGPAGVTLFFVPLLFARFIFKSFMETREVFMNTLEALAHVLDAKDKYTWGHSDRVAQYAVELARQLKLPEDQIEVIHHMALLHDVGKIGVSDELLTRVGCLSDHEFDLIKLHPVIGANILNEISYHGAEPEFIRHHHEKYDGSGYPDCLRGEEISLGARIITLADSFDAMTSDRSYRKKMSIEEALMEIRRCKGVHFDPILAEDFISCWEEKATKTSYEAILEMATTSNE